VRCQVQQRFSVDGELSAEYGAVQRGWWGAEVSATWGMSSGRQELLTIKDVATVLRLAGKTLYFDGAPL